MWMKNTKEFDHPKGELDTNPSESKLVYWSSSTIHSWFCFPKLGESWMILDW
jgi:hypothetical protein